MSDKKIETSDQGRDIASADIAQKVGVAGALMVVARFMVRLLGLASTLILARILVPDDFAFVAVSMAVIGICQGMTSFQVTHALIYLKDTRDEDWSTAFTLEAMRGLILSLFLLILGPDLLSLFGLELYAESLMWLAPLPFLGGIANPKMQLFYKELDMRVEFFITLVSKLGSIGLTLYLALAWQSYHALIIGSLFAQIFTTIISYFVRPFLPRLTLRSFRRLFTFSGWSMAGSMINVVGANLDQFLIASYLGPKSSGSFRVALELVRTPISQIAEPLAQGLFPAFSKIREEGERLKGAFAKSLSLLTAITLPVSAGLALTAIDAVPLLLGSKWQAAVLILQVMAPLEAIAVVALTVNPLILATGNTKILFTRSLMSNSVRIPLLVIGISKFGLIGLLGAHAISTLFMMALNFNVSRRFLSFGLVAYFGLTWRSWLSVMLMVGLVLLVQSQFFSSPIDGVEVNFMRLALSVFVGAASYSLCHLALWVISGKPESPSAESGLISMLGPLYAKISGRLA